MKKIPTLFLRGEDHLVTPEVNLEAQWVIDGEGVATRKWDGTACMVEDGQLFKRYTWKVPDEKEAKFPPAGFIQTGEYIPERGKVEGWLPVGEGKEDKWHRQAAFTVLASGNKQDEIIIGPPEDGTYELLGPKVQGNPEEIDQHILIRHGDPDLHPQPPRDWVGLHSYFFGLALIGISIEGIVWHHEDGRMVKIKGKDFGIRRSR